MAVSSLDERGLVESHKAGNDAAFVEIVHAYYPELLSHAVRRLREPKSAEDAVQEALLRAFRALPRFNGEYRLGAWLHRILENVCADEGNRRRRESEVLERVVALPLGEDPEPHDQAAARMPDPNFVRALASLSPTYREALLLRYVDGLPYRDVAAATGVSEENARARVHRARRVLRRVLTGAGAFGLWVFTGVRRSERAVAESLDRAAGRLPVATTQLAAVGSTVPAKAVLASRMASLVAAAALPIAGLGIGTTVDWLRGHGDDSRERDGGAGVAGEFAAPSAVDEVSSLALEQMIADVLAHRADRGPVAATTARPAKVDGDVARWDWFEPDRSPDAGAREGERSTWGLQAGVVPVGVEGSESELTGTGRLTGPQSVVNGTLTAKIGTADSRHPDAPLRVVIEFVEAGGRSQPVHAVFEGTVVAREADRDRTRYGVEGSFRVTGRELGLSRGGTFRATVLSGSTDPSSVQLDISPTG